MRVSRGKCLGWCTLQTLPMVGAGTQLKINGVFGGETSWVHRAMVVFRLKTCDFEEKTHVFFNAFFATRILFNHKLLHQGFQSHWSRIESILSRR